jgi:hypothetical protein
MPAGNELVYDDGRVSADGSWLAWLTFIHHLRIAPALRSSHLGCSEDDATHWLVLDRDTRTTSVGPAADIARLLRQAAQPALTSETLTACRDTTNKRMSEPQNVQVLIAQAMRREQQLVHALDVHSGLQSVPPRRALTPHLREFFSHDLSSTRT